MVALVSLRRAATLTPTHTRKHVHAAQSCLFGPAFKFDDALIDRAVNELGFKFDGRITSSLHILPNA